MTVEATIRDAGQVEALHAQRHDVLNPRAESVSRDFVAERLQAVPARTDEEPMECRVAVYRLLAAAGQLNKP